MTTIEIDNSEFKLPDGWSEINLNKLIDIKKIADREKTYANKILYDIDTLCLLMDCNRHDLYKLNKDEFNQLIELVSWVYTLPEKSDKLEIKFKIDDLEYKYISKKYDKLNMSEIITIETLLKEKDDLEQHCIIMAVLFRPEIDGKIAELEDDMEHIITRANVIREFVSVEELYGPLIFFSNGGTEFSTKTSEHSSVLKVKKVNS